MEFYSLSWSSMVVWFGWHCTLPLRSSVTISRRVVSAQPELIILATATDTDHETTWRHKLKQRLYSKASLRNPPVAHPSRPSTLPRLHLDRHSNMANDLTPLEVVLVIQLVVHGNHCDESPWRLGMSESPWAPWLNVASFNMALP